MAIPLAETLITLGASLQPICSGARPPLGGRRKTWVVRGSLGRKLGGYGSGYCWAFVSVLTTAAGWPIMRKSSLLQMSEEQLKAFWETIQADTALQQKLQGVTDPDLIVAIAK